MLTSVILGIIGGLAVSRFMRRRWQGGCGSQRGFRGGPFGGGFGPRRLYWLAQELGLDQMQKEQVRDIFHSARRTVSEVRFSRFDQLRTLMGSMQADKFDRAAIDAAIAHETEKEAHARKELLDKIELFHSGLTTEQKAKLAQFLDGNRGDGRGHDAAHGPDATRL